MGAHQVRTGAQSASGLKDRVSVTDTRKERPLEGGSRPQGAKEAASQMDIIVQATPGGDAGGGPAGEAAVRVAFAHPEGEREEQGSVIPIHICGIT
jgi:hypothetical protein